MSIVRKIVMVLFRVVASIILIVLLAAAVTGVSPIYDFRSPGPFRGPDIYDPYSCLDTTYCWKRANFHTHTRVKGLMNECKKWPDGVLADLEKFGYDIVTFSNHNELTQHPTDSSLQVNVYEHGYNILKYHKLVFGSGKVKRFDHLVPILASQKQFQLEYLGKDADIIQMNHPLRTIGTSQKHMSKLSGYSIMELDSGRSTENEYWDWALSSGHYSFGLANDDLHHTDRSHCIAVRCSFLCCPSARYEDIRNTLLNGCWYSMRIPDYGHGVWNIKYEMNRHVPSVTDIGLDNGTIYMSLSEPADSIKVIGQGHSTLSIATECSEIAYQMRAEDSYARITAYFPKGEVIYSNPFARYDASISTDPFDNRPQKLNIPLTLLFNLMLATICACLILSLYKIIFK